MKGNTNTEDDGKTELKRKQVQRHQRVDSWQDLTEAEEEEGPLFLIDRRPKRRNIISEEWKLAEEGLRMVIFSKIIVMGACRDGF